ncbi:MAG: polysulfide reductase NrfD [Zoogloeaceae bacterium]|jgi:molybdopterin-containing oxidoreductase family membrane subunit|nr:polysulfide reductase NrfD [Zoogloeaceae bacterium]
MAALSAPAAPPIETRPRTGVFIGLLAAGGLFLLLALAAFLHFEHSGHIATGMDNQIVWGIPHVFAVFLVVAASGVLNVASIGSVFGKPDYKARAPLSGLLALTMMAGGLVVLAADLGRPDRLLVAVTHFNFKSIFALNMLFYSGFFAIVAAYLVTLMNRRLNPYARALGFLAFFWRLALTTATGSIFGFLIARSAYGSALMAPMFIIYSFAYGLAAFLIVQSAMYAWNGLASNARVLARMKNLLAVFVGAALYFTVVMHLTNLYFAKQIAYERFLLLDGGVYTTAFWFGQIGLGGVLPLALLLIPGAGQTRVVIASALVTLGGLAQMFVTIVGGQAFPLDLFPGHAVSSRFQDGIVNAYAPVPGEFALGFGGFAFAFLITVIAVRVLPFLPRDAADASALKTTD